MIRSPLPVSSGDTYAANLLIALQLLYMYGLSNSVDLDDLNEQLDRTPGSVDMSSYLEKTLLENKFLCHIIDPFDLAKALSSDQEEYDYWRQYLAELTNQPAYDHPLLRRDYERWREYGQVVLASIKLYSDQHSNELRYATPHDVDVLLADGWQVILDLYPSSEPSLCNPGFIFGLSEGFYQVYDPRYGLTTMSYDDLWEQRCNERLVVHAWKKLAL